MKIEQFQVNTKFLNSLPPEWSKFVTDVKLVKDLHTTNFDPLHAYLQQHELHANEVRLMRERNQDPLAPVIDPGLVVPVLKQGDDPIDAINKTMSFLSTVVTSRFPSTNNQLRNSSNPRQQATIHDGREQELIVQEQEGIIQFRDKVLLVEAQGNGKVLNEEELEFLADPTKAVLMANLSSYGSDVLSEKSQQIRPMLYDGNVIAKETNMISIDDPKETLMLEEESRSKMLLKQSDPLVLEKKINIKPVNYAVLNQLSKDFGKRFVPQQELSAEQAFWFQMSNPSTDSSDASPVKVDVPSELPKVSLVNASLKKLKFHLAQYDSMVKKRITPDALTEGEWGFEHTKAVFINEIILF
ncbi:hypothetical protein Tco_0789795 [Tanacetum coccineum]